MLGPHLLAPQEFEGLRPLIGGGTAPKRFSLVQSTSIVTPKNRPQPKLFSAAGLLFTGQRHFYLATFGGANCDFFEDALVVDAVIAHSSHCE